MDTAGHVSLSDAESTKLTRTKTLSIGIVMACILIGVNNRSNGANMSFGAVAALLCKLCESFCKDDASWKETAVFSAKACAWQFGCLAIGFGVGYTLVFVG